VKWAYRLLYSTTTSPPHHLTTSLKKPVEKGTLVEFKVNGQLRLGVAERPEGKKNWVVIDGNGQSHTLHPRQVTYEVKGGSYSAEDVPAFESSAAESVEPDSLEVAWELLSEEGEATDP